ncbi:hypothetical protein HV824_10100 [Myxococcus sp. AM009]|uniref:hypothetical protein n=1 Tax=Myxococcus sp. AM009 TaxID=2745137 RepID=UPI0015962197|nr:hypothetical protein [Myxococcus sp. AM009]NVI98474.1 hypothetical protein [Myxococcus sp. AM009]
MKRDATGNAPLVEASARGLGVRPSDLAPCELGLAHPNKGGMSVAPTLADLPPHRVPERLGHLREGASGADGDRVWVVGTAAFVDGAFAQGLSLRVTSATHAHVEPDDQRPFAQYEAHLAATATLWTVGEP